LTPFGIDLSAGGTVGPRVLRLNVKPKTPGEYGLPKQPVPELRITTT